MLIIKFILMLVLGYMSFILSTTFVPVMKEVYYSLNLYYGFFTGVAIFIFLYVFEFTYFGKVSKHNLKWLMTWSHEHIHLLFLVIFFRPLSDLQINRDGSGHVAHYGGSNFIVGLSPYCFPMFTIILMLIYPVVISKYWWYLDIFVGLTFAFHLVSFARQFGFWQKDISSQGPLFSISFIIFFNIFFSSVVLLTMKYGGARAFTRYTSIVIDKIKLIF